MRILLLLSLAALFSANHSLAGGGGGGPGADWIVAFAGLESGNNWTDPEHFDGGLADLRAFYYNRISYQLYEHIRSGKLTEDQKTDFRVVSQQYQNYKNELGFGDDD